MIGWKLVPLATTAVINQIKTETIKMANDQDYSLTRADRGALVYETLTRLLHSAIKNSDAQTANLLKQQYHGAVAHLEEASGAKFTLSPAVSTLADGDQAALLAQTIRSSQQFITFKWRRSDLTITLVQPNKRLKNLVDYTIYNHLATVASSDGKKILAYFAVGNRGQYVLSEPSYWEEVVTPQTTSSS